MTDEDIIIRLRDFRPAGICSDARHWFRRNNLDWREFVRHGIPLSVLRSVPDEQSNVDRVEKVARRRLSNGR